MANEILVHPEFRRSAKRLAKKYRSFPDDLGRLTEQLKETSLLGVSLGRNLRKIRRPIKSKGSGKSGGARIIMYVLLIERTVYLAAIYDKSEFTTIDIAYLHRLVDEIESQRK